MKVRKGIKLRWKATYFGSTMLPLALIVLVTTLGGNGAGVAGAQSNPNTDNGVKPFGSYDATSIDTVDLATGALSLRIPLVSYPQRGNFPPVQYVIAFSSKAFTINPHCGSQSCSPHWQAATMPLGINTPSFGVYILTDKGTPGLYYSKLPTGYYQFSAISSDESKHILYGSPFSSGLIAADGSGYGCVGCNASSPPGTFTLYTRAGLFVTSTYVPEDPNGNVENTSDTMGRAFGTTTSTTDYTGCSGSFPTTSASIMTLPSYQGSSTQIKTCSAGFTTKTAFNDSSYYDPLGNGPPWGLNSTVVEASSTAGSPVVQTVLLYDGNSWSTSPSWVFEYNNGQNGSGVVNYGDLTKITFPTGGTIQYTWANGGGCDHPGATNMSRGIVQRVENAGDGSPAVVRTYSGDTVNDGVNDTVHFFTNLGNSCSWYETKTMYYSGTQSSGTLLKTVSTDYTFSNDPDSSYYPDQVNHIMNVLPIRVTTTLPNGLVSKIEKDYQTGTVSSYSMSTGNVVQQREYDWGNGAPGALVRCTATTYRTQQNSAYFNSNLLDLPATVSVYSGACGTGTLMAQTTNGYDESSLASSGVTVQRDSGASGRTVRGNLTSIHRWLNTTGGTLNEAYTYYDTGEKYQYTDPKSNPPTTFYYDTAYDGAYLTKTQMPNTGSVAHIVSAGYDFNTGLMTSYTDQNSNISNYGYDQLLRMTSASFPDTGCVKLSYPSFTSVQKAVCLTASQSIQTTYNFDGLGRPVNTTLSEGSGSYIYTRTAYDAQGRKSQVWNPSRCDQRTASNCSGETTWGTSQFQYDGLGRQTLLIPPDGTASANNERTSYSSNTVTFTDEAGNQWSRTTDALGRMTKVLEPNGSSTTPSTETDYTYDALGNLTCVEQHGGVTGTGCSAAPSNDATSPWRVRRFTYDSLSRLLTAKNPETGTTTYTYLTNGLVCAGDVSLPCSKTDARGMQISFAYDVLNRPTGKTYSDSEPAVGYTYDASAANNFGIGHRTGMTDASGSSSWTYDTIGRIWSDTRIIGTVAKSVSTLYNLDGSVSTMTYPSGAVVEYAPDTAGRTVAVTDDTNGIYFAKNGLYAPHGALSSLLLGYSATFAGMSESNQYDKRLQSAVLAVAAPAGTLLSLSYNFGLGVNDNGNVYGITNNKDTTRSQSFSYDTLNRVSKAQSGSVWGVTFTYDPWSNLYQTGSVPGTTWQAMTVSQQASVANQFTLNGYGYDTAGNVLNDGIHSGCGTTAFAWNAEEQMSCGAGTAYSYDGDGGRVKKTGGSATPTLYWGGGAGESLAESDLSGNLTSEYIFLNGKRLARRDLSTGNVYFYFSDMLNSSNVVANAVGAIQNESDFYPFGGERQITANLSNQHYKFTGKERDTESGNDYFGARYYASTMGRFLSPDWSAKIVPVPYAKLDNPQSLNLYAYVGNNPLTRFDPDGHIDCSGKNAAGVGCQAIAKWNQEHGIKPTDKKSNFPGVAVKLPNGKTVPDPHSPTGVMMAPNSDVSDVAAAGRKAGQDAANAGGPLSPAATIGFTVALGKAVGTGGEFDEQRMGPQSDVLTGGFQQLPQFRDVSNFNVGLFSQQAGMSLEDTLQTAGNFAHLFSKNYDANSPYGLAPQTAEFIRSGYAAGASGAFNPQ